MTHISVTPGTPVLIDKVQYRAIHRTNDDRIVLEDVETRAHQNYTDADITNLFSLGRLRFELKAEVRETFNPQFADFGLLPKKWKDIAYERLSHILAVLQHSNRLSRPVVKRVVAAVADQIYEKKKRNGEIPEDQDRGPCPPSYSSMVRHVRIWRESHDIRALVPNFYARGSHDKKLDVDVHQAISDAITTLWLSKPRKTRDAVFEGVLARIKNINALRAQHEHLQKPSYRTVTRAIAAVDRKTAMAARHSPAEANAEFRTYTQLPVADYPNHVVMIDDTPLDLTILDTEHRTTLGRPYLTCIIDVYSRMLLGFYVSFSPPSADTAMLAIRHAILGKSYVKKKYPMVQNDWIAVGKFQNLVSDQHASFKKESFRDALAGLRIVQHFAPKGESWVRPFIERFFGTIATSLLHQMPGTTYSNIVERGKDVPAEDACFTAAQFDCLLHIWAVDYYNQRKNSGLVGVPHHVYLNGTKRVPIKLPRAIEDLDCLLRSSDDVKLTKQGVLVNKLLYNSPALTLMRRRGDAPDDVNVRYNPLDVSQVWVLDPRTLSFITVPAVDQDYTHNLTLDQHLAIRNYAEKEADKQSDRIKLSDARMKLFGLADDAVAMTKATKQAGKRIGRLRQKPLDRAKADDNVNMSATARPSTRPKEDYQVGLVNTSTNTENLPTKVVEEDEFNPNESRIQYSIKEVENV